MKFSLFGVSTKDVANFVSCVLFGDGLELPSFGLGQNFCCARASEASHLLQRKTVE